jgi:uncharacterized protein YigA (DUF484 family)
LDLVQNPDAEFYGDLVVLGRIPYSVRKSAVFAHARLERASEEKHALRLEIRGLMEHYQANHLILEEALVASDNGGVKACLLHAAAHNELKQYVLSTCAERKFNMDLPAQDTVLTGQFFAANALEFHDSDVEEQNHDFANLPLPAPIEDDDLVGHDSASEAESVYADSD